MAKSSTSFEEGNKAAEKWTEKAALELIESVYNYNEENKSNYTLAAGLMYVDAPAKIWSYLVKVFHDNKPVLNAIKKVERQLEQRIVNNTLTGDAKSAAMAIFILKNKHGYEDKTKVENADVKPEPIEFSDSASDD